MQINSILVPTDFSEDSYYALAHAIELAKWRGCALTILNVNPDESMLFRYLSEKEFDKLRQEALNDARRQLEKLVERFPDLQEVEHHFHIRRGNPAVEILEELEAHPVDLVVIGSHGRSSQGLRFFYYGATVEKIVRRAKTSILVTRMQERRERKD
jgi:nucleotide-binding universal stress UspA family protein